ncbi:hypothetical protein JDV02_009043 [Purpureocillium takamizusanense]|uniref:Uncharacterized protein n=1 Tax=Purpureocillium takamizusanense TaxID=2060973 RepID=A0A9Q8VFA4_9HYPO|nr:uncharacterized protein JDV02_009043 [Purpureocillium takamizusanense]UNI23211.1 hypothetical protein JDV02_009043 [Purpureocillium takamizusanense]
MAMAMARTQLQLRRPGATGASKTVALPIPALATAALRPCIHAAPIMHRHAPPCRTKGRTHPVRRRWPVAACPRPPARRYQNSNLPNPAKMALLDGVRQGQRRTLLVRAVAWHELQPSISDLSLGKSDCLTAGAKYCSSSPPGKKTLPACLWRDGCTSGLGGVQTAKQSPPPPPPPPPPAPSSDTDQLQLLHRPVPTSFFVKTTSGHPRT